MYIKRAEFRQESRPVNTKNVLTVKTFSETPFTLGKRANINSYSLISFVFPHYAAV